MLSPVFPLWFSLLPSTLNNWLLTTFNLNLSYLPGRNLCLSPFSRDYLRFILDSTLFDLVLTLREAVASYEWWLSLFLLVSALAFL